MGVVYIFICLCLCSAAELTRYHFAPAAGMIQLKGVISQNALMMAETPELTGLTRRGRKTACCAMGCLRLRGAVAQWLHCRRPTWSN